MKHSFSVFHATMRRLCQIQTLLDSLHAEAKPQARLVPGSPLPRGSIIVFPSSFNPPTTAHLALLKQAQQFSRRQKQQGQSIHIYAAMSKLTVNKEHVERPLLRDRILLLQDLLQHRLPAIGILLFNRGLYVEQAEAIRTSFPRVKKLFFLIGFDKIVQILDPRYYSNRDQALSELFALADLLVAPRGTNDENTLRELLLKAENQPFAAHISAFPFSNAYRNISSSQVRRSPGEHLQNIPYEVRRFMRKTRAYAPPVRRADGTSIDVYEHYVQTVEKHLRCISNEK